MNQITEEFRTYRAFPVTWHDLYDADIETRGAQTDDYRIAFGVEFDESGKSGKFWTVERKHGDRWEDDTPHFDQRYVAGYKCRIDLAHHQNQVKAFIERRVPKFWSYLQEDQAAINAVLDDGESL